MEDDRAQTDLGLAADIEDLQIQPDDPPPEDAPPKQPRRRFVGRREAAAAGAAAPPPGDNNATTTTSVQAPKPARPPRLLNQVPPELRDDPVLRDALDLLPANYNFEVPKTIHRIRTLASRRVALQLPEGLLLFATTLADILAQFCPSLEEPPMIMGDMTYGACCIDDYTARALGCDLLIHYGHSCLIPVNVTTGIKILYVFVDIGIETGHLLETVTRNLDAGSTVALVGTIQFNATIHGVRAALERAGFRIVVPQVAPLSRGEILGCTSPRLPTDDGIDSILYLGDGRFHLESIMIHNPDLPAYRYDPYNRSMTREWYGHAEMHDVRRGAIRTARGARKWGLILGSLGRQGNPHTLALVEAALTRRAIPFLNLVLSEITPAKLALLSDVDCWVQVACPRISIDWGYTYARPLLNPYEALVALGEREDWADGPYPMDYYGRDGLGRAVAAAGEAGQAVA